MERKVSGPQAVTAENQDGADHEKEASLGEVTRAFIEDIFAQHSDAVQRRDLHRVCCDTSVEFESPKSGYVYTKASVYQVEWWDHANREPEHKTQENLGFVLEKIDTGTGEAITEDRYFINQKDGKVYHIVWKEGQTPKAAQASDTWLPATREGLSDAMERISKLNVVGASQEQ